MSFLEATEYKDVLPNVKSLESDESNEDGNNILIDVQDTKTVIPPEGRESSDTREKLNSAGSSPRKSQFDLTLSSSMKSVVNGEYDPGIEIEDTEGTLCGYKPDNTKKEEKVSVSFSLLIYLSLLTLPIESFPYSSFFPENLCKSILSHIQL